MVGFLHGIFDGNTATYFFSFRWVLFFGGVLLLVGLLSTALAFAQWRGSLLLLYTAAVLTY